MDFDKTMILIPIIVIASVIVTYFLNKRYGYLADPSDASKKEIIKGKVELFDYIYDPLTEWQFWMIKFVDSQIVIKIWYDLKVNYEEVNSIKIGDLVEIEYCELNKEFVASKVKKL